MSEQSASTDTIRRDIESSRERVEHSLHGLEERLSPRHLMDRTFDYFSRNRGEASEFGRNLGRTVRDNPVPVLLIGAGLMTLAMSSRRDRDSASPFEDAYWPGAEVDNPDFEDMEGLSGGGESGSTKSRMADKASAARHRAADKYGSARERLRQGYRQARGAAGQRSGNMRQYSRNAMDQVNATYDRQPLLYGALAATVGLVIAALLPHTRREDAALGPYRDDLKRSATEGAKEAVKRAETVTEATMGAAAEEAERQGLTPSDLKAEAEETADKATDVAQAASDAAKEESARQNPLNS